MNVQKFTEISAKMAQLDLEFQEITNLSSLFDPFSVFNGMGKEWLENSLSLLDGIGKAYGARARDVVKEFNDLLRLSWNV